MSTNVKEMVNNPSHYNIEGESFSLADLLAHTDFIRGSIIKYVFRAGKKDDELQDLQKAQWYLNYLINKLNGRISKD